MKVAILLALVAVAASAPADVQKRAFLSSLGDLWHSFTDALSDLWHNASAAFKTLWNQSKAQFESLVHGIDFDAVVGKLVDQIDSTYTQGACVTACVSGAGAIGLGVAAALVEPACQPLCHAALAYLEEKARQGK